MIARSTPESSHLGTLGKDVQKPATFILELLDFIRDELPRWRDRPERPYETSESHLTSQLCAHLNSTTRHSAGWDSLQFRTEEPDERERGRKIDLIPAPSGPAILIEGRRYLDFDALLPIECKRLPTPKDKDRDKREYVFSQFSSTGGIQRFKAGHHGAGHKLGAMIAYVQQETSMFWNTQVAEWIIDLAASGQKGWTAKDLLHLEQDDTAQQVATLSSSHTREKSLPEITLRHLWVQMN